ncbi:MAG TPA: CoA-transferase [Burkholderiales bacterium]|nr:CoA-transferase [Burkholderiales bacterium]
MIEHCRTAADLARLVPDGALIALPADYSMPAMTVVRELIVQKKRELRLLGVPILGMAADLLIGAGCVAEVETSAVSLGEAGFAPRFTEAAEEGAIEVRNATCPAIHTALQAAEKGVPYMPVGGLLGSDLLKERREWRTEAGLVLIPALRPDVALFHARWADEAGNVWVGRRRELATAAHAARNCYVTYEEPRAGDMLEDEVLAPGVISSVYVTGTAHAPRGAWPFGVPGLYGIDDAHVAGYARAAKTRAGFQRYLDEWVLTPRKSFSPA